MKTKRPISLFIFCLFVLASCAPAAKTPAPIAVEAQKPIQPSLAPALPAAEAEQPAEAGAPAWQMPLPTMTAPMPQQPGGIVSPLQPPLDNYFNDYGTNPYQDTRRDHLSTFGLDVDTASYSVARRYVRDGSLPPAEAVRVEEFINSFEMGYAAPPDVSFSIYADGAPSPFDGGESTLLRVGVQGYRVSEMQRKPAHLTFVIDVSGSMEMENRLGLVKRSLQLLVDRLRPDDTVAIVVYGSEARTVLAPISGLYRDNILQAIYSLQTEGSTNAEAGLQLGYRWAAEMLDPEVTNRVVLCSDGVANVGNTGPDAILESVGQYVQRGIFLTTVGFGMGNFNDVLMEQLADRGDGNYAYVDTLDEAQRLFVDDLTSTLQVIARDAKVQVDFNPEVVSYYRLVGYENRAIADQDFRNDAVDAGELGAGHSATALYAVQLIPGAQGRVATVQLRWQDADTRQVREINGNVNTWDLAGRFEDAAPRYQLAVTAAEYAEVLRHSRWAQNVSLTQVYYQAARVAELLREDEQVREFADLVWKASQLQQPGW